MSLVAASLERLAGRDRSIPDRRERSPVDRRPRRCVCAVNCGDWPVASASGVDNARWARLSLWSRLLPINNPAHRLVHASLCLPRPFHSISLPPTLSLSFSLYFPRQRSLPVFLRTRSGAVQRNRIPGSPGGSLIKIKKTQGAVLGKLLLSHMIANAMTAMFPRFLPSDSRRSPRPLPSFVSSPLVSAVPSPPPF